ncbi:UNVERIFIED_CONTAM: hypothetical protein FKN15_037424 [Acipenser sinensis]
MEKLLVLNPNLYVMELSHGEFTWKIKRHFKYFQALHQERLKFKTLLKIPLPTRTEGLILKKSRGIPCLLLLWLQQCMLQVVKKLVKKQSGAACRPFLLPKSLSASIDLAFEISKSTSANAQAFRCLPTDAVLNNKILRESMSCPPMATEDPTQALEELWKIRGFLFQFPLYSV